MSDTENKNKKKPKSEAAEWIKSILFAVVIAVIIRAFVFEFVVVDQSSMYPTLHSGDKLGVMKITYLFDSPERGDIVIAKVASGKNYVKRVIAFGGETIEIKDSVVYVNGEVLDEAYLPDNLEYEDYALTTIPENTLFLMGDNRPTSIDSRSRSVGFVDEDNILGKVLVRLSPLTWYN